MRRNRIGKRWFAAVAAAVLAMGVCTGCGSESAAGPGDGPGPGNGEPREEQPQEIRGAYVETEISLPEEWSAQSVLQVSRAGDEIRLLVQTEETDGTALREWKYDGSFAEVTEEWMKEMAFPRAEWMEASLLRNEAGGTWLFAYYPEEGEEDYRGHLWKIADGQAVEITPESWTVLNEQYGFYPVVRGIVAREDGVLAALYYDEVELLSGEDGSVQDSFSALSGNYGEELAAEGSTLYVTAVDDADAYSSLEQHSPDGETAVVSLPRESSGFVYIDALPDGALISLSREGLFRYRPEEKEWEMLLDGMDAFFGLTDTWCKGMTAQKDGTVYVLTGQGEKLSLYRYAYDPDAVRRTAETLTLYTVDESYLLQQAAILYHQAHPEVRIQIDAMYSLAELYSPHDYEAARQELNTILMGKEAPDLVVLDHLDADTYADKGVLADLSDVVSPMEESGALLANITGAFAREDGSRYVVPLQFGFPMALGREIFAEDMGTMQSLSAFLASADESYMGPQTAEELIDQFYPFFGGELAEGGKLNREALSEQLMYLKAIADNCGLVAQHENGARAYGVWDLASRAKLAFDEAEGFKDCMLPLSMAKQIDGEFTAFEKVFTPGIRIGVCAQSEHLDTALDFLRFALSQEVQDTDYRHGFPVNAASLLVQMGQDRSDAEAVASLASADGEDEVLYINVYSEEYAKKLVELCRGLERPAAEDEQIRTVLEETLPDYLSGARSLEETIDRVEAGLKMYLAE